MARVETERMVLRPITLGDTDALVALESDPEVMRFLTGGTPTPRDQVIETIRQHLDGRWMGVMERCGLRYVRTFHLEWDDPIDGTELGEVEYELLRSEWITGATRRSP